MKKQLEQVAEFHRAFNHPILTQGQAPTQERIELRKKLILEEFNELKEAHESGSIEHVAKEACDLVYVCLGTILEFGWQCIIDDVYAKCRIYEARLIDVIEMNCHSFRKQKKTANIENILCCISMYVASIGISNQFERCFDEIHRSNMSKLDANGLPVYREDGKVIKSNLYSPADLSFLTKEMAVK